MSSWPSATISGQGGPPAPREPPPSPPGPPAVPPAWAVAAARAAGFPRAADRARIEPGPRAAATAQGHAQTATQGRSPQKRARGWGRWNDKPLTTDICGPTPAHATAARQTEAMQQRTNQAGPMIDRRWQPVPSCVVVAHGGGQVQRYARAPMRPRPEPGMEPPTGYLLVKSGFCATRGVFDHRFRGLDMPHSETAHWPTYRHYERYGACLRKSLILRNRYPKGGPCWPGLWPHRGAKRADRGRASQRFERRTGTPRGMASLRPTICVTSYKGRSVATPSLRRVATPARRRSHSQRSHTMAANRSLVGDLVDVIPS